jgi:glycosyltransferase A (GT-A) superfamily protein (DUF2064 family)
MDTPQVTANELDTLMVRLHLVASRWASSALLGPALDGGWWIIGLAGADPYRVFPGVPMSTPTTGRIQRRRLRDLGLDVVAVPARRDIDTIADLQAVAQTIPLSRTTAVARSLLDYFSPVSAGEAA